MKKKSKFLIIIFFFLLLFAFILNLRVSYNQGINYEVRQVRIPLYLKIIDFFSRHFHYRELVREITKSCKTDEEKVFNLFGWTHKNIKRIPNGFPIVDDHAWHIIVRGYGVNDQLNDVFVILCNYVGIKAFFTWIWSKDYRIKIPLSFVRLREKWYIFDPYYGAYFKDKKGNLADIEAVKSGGYLVEGEADSDMIDYSDYVDNIPLFKDVGLNRANTQSPLNRLLLEIKKWSK